MLSYFKRRLIEAIDRSATNAAKREINTATSELSNTLRREVSQLEANLEAKITRRMEDFLKRELSAGGSKTIERTLHLVRQEYTVMPRFEFHQPLDYHKDTLPPSFDPCVRLPNETLPLPGVNDRMGYPADDAAYLDMGRYDADLIRTHIKLLDRSDAIAILDFGCSSGRVLRHFYSDAKENGWRLFGSDIQARPIEWMRRNFPPTFVVFVGSTIAHLPFPDNSLDAIYGISIFTHIKYHWDMWLLELRRVLKPGGVLIQTIHTENAWNFYIKNKNEQWVQNAHSPLVLNSASMDVDYLYYGDISVSQVFWKREIAKEFWGRYLEVVDLLPPPEKYSFQDWMICRKPT